MEREGDRGMAGEPEFEETAGGIDRAPEDAPGRPGPTWRAWVLSILAAIILSVTATLLLGGSFSLRKAAALPAGTCGASGACCPPAGTGAGK